MEVGAVTPDHMWVVVECWDIYLMDDDDTFHYSANLRDAFLTDLEGTVCYLPWDLQLKRCHGMPFKNETWSIFRTMTALHEKEKM